MLGQRHRLTLRLCSCLLWCRSPCLLQPWRRLDTAAVAACCKAVRWRSVRCLSWHLLLLNAGSALQGVWRQLWRLAGSCCAQFVPCRGRPVCMHEVVPVCSKLSVFAAACIKVGQADVGVVTAMQTAWRRVHGAAARAVAAVYLFFVLVCTLCR